MEWFMIEDERNVCIYFDIKNNLTEKIIFDLSSGKESFNSTNFTETISENR